MMFSHVWFLIVPCFGWVMFNCLDLYGFEESVSSKLDFGHCSLQKD
jgi:hypothetical protein